MNAKIELLKCPILQKKEDDWKYVKQFKDTKINMLKIKISKEWKKICDPTVSPTLFYLKMKVFRINRKLAWVENLKRWPC